MTIKAGDRIPDVTLMHMTDKGPQPISTSDIFKGKKVVLFSVPGAFTPTCSAKHLPGFVHNPDKCRAKGIDEIVCVSVNDAFVMNAWAKDQAASGKVLMIADGNAEFAKKLGLELDASKYGMGTRGQRFAMVVDNGTVKKLFVEEPGAFKVSSAEHVLENL